MVYINTINTHLIVKPEPNWLSAGTINKRITNNPSTKHQTYIQSGVFFFKKITLKITKPLTTTLIAPNFNFNFVPYKDIKKHISPT